MVFMMTLITSCQKKETGETGDGNGVTSITLSSSKGNEFNVNTETTFEVKNNKGGNVTAESELYVTGKKISGASYTFTEKGVFEVYAKYKELTSSKLSITVKEVPPTNNLSEFSAKILVHDFTGTWCGFCADALLKLNDKVAQFPGKVIPIEIHANGSGSTDDGKESFDFPKTEIFGVNAFPTVWHNYDKEFLYFPKNEMKEYVSKKIKTGLAIHYDLENEKATVRIKSDTPIKDKTIVAFLVEGKLYADQQNYDNNNESSPAYKKGSVIKNFEYHNVARASLTSSPLGDVISDATGNEHTIEFSLKDKTERVKDMNNTKVVAYLLDDKGKYLNAQVAVAKENKDFD